MARRIKKAAPERKSHVYVVGFSSGVIKVGRTSNVKTRLYTLDAEARKFGLTMPRRWVSVELTREESIRREAELLQACEAVAKERRLKEYFRMNFDMAVRFAEAHTGAESHWARVRARVQEGSGNDVAEV